MMVWFCDCENVTAVIHGVRPQKEKMKFEFRSFPPMPRKDRVMDGAPVIFQEVVHSILTGEAVCDEQAVTLESEWTTTRMPHGRRSVESGWRGW
jgi:hypothetical protein